MIGHDVITLHASVKRFVWFGALLRITALIHRKPVVVRAFGGALDLNFEGTNRLSKWAYKMAFSNSLVLLETKHLVKVFKNQFPSANIEWLPNSRPVVENSGAVSSRNGRFYL